GDRFEGNDADRRFETDCLFRHTEHDAGGLILCEGVGTGVPHLHPLTQATADEQLLAVRQGYARRLEDEALELGRLPIADLRWRGCNSLAVIATRGRTLRSVGRICVRPQ
ncbi:MAG: hypothetical protein QOI59_5759, partial [Gammaproteobacteria bacterium]|nr:hypothetical protein [Gammaproteobacteria bacterium]